MGLLKKIRRNKGLSEDQVAQQAAKAVREHGLVSSELLGLTGIFSDPRGEAEVLDVLQDWVRPHHHGRQEDSGVSALRH